MHACICMYVCMYVYIFAFSSRILWFLLIMLVRSECIYAVRVCANVNICTCVYNIYIYVCIYIYISMITFSSTISFWLLLITPMKPNLRGTTFPCSTDKAFVPLHMYICVYVCTQAEIPPAAEAVHSFLFCTYMYICIHGCFGMSVCIHSSLPVCIYACMHVLVSLYV